MLKELDLWLMRLEAIKSDEQSVTQRTVMSITLIQTLIALDLENNQLGAEGAKYVADALEINRGS